MAITAEQVKSIRQELDKLRPASTLAGNRELSIKQPILALAPALERMKKRGFEVPEIIAKLAEKGIEVRPQTLTTYLAEARRQTDTRKIKRQASSPHCSSPKEACRNAGPKDADTPRRQPSKSIAKESPNARDFPPRDNEDSSSGKTSPRYGTFPIIPDTPLGEL